MSPSLVIAVVDDDPDVRRSIASLLRSYGIASLDCGRAADLLALAPETFNCVVSDIHMPEMTGLELQAEMVSRGWCHPLILMTAYATTATRAQGLGAGAVAFLTKPIDPDRLLAAIGTARTA